MARIPEGELERLKAEVSVERLAKSQGVVLERHGTQWVGLCPFHDDCDRVVRRTLITKASCR